ncbi:MAG: DUF5010 domain-containing protein [Planctomycetes bacterium]|nr:DUF5010 domain-containing protein [Planctomycetota bacterium]
MVDTPWGLAAIVCVLSCVAAVWAADFDGDLDVDTEDFGHFQACLSDAASPAAPGCADADLDGDGRVDAYDLLAFQVCFSGPGVPTEQACILPPAEDVTLVPPPRIGPLLGTITGYEMDSGCPYGNPATCEIPVYRSYDRDSAGWWDNLVEELIHSRVHVVMMHGRGCYSPTTGDAGNGDMCPRLLRRLVEAIDRCEGARDVLRLGMFDDTGAYQGARNQIEGLPDGTLFDLANPDNWVYFWNYNMRIWFDTVPPDLWYRLDGRPVVAFWGPVGMANVQGNASRLFDYLRTSFINRYGENPHFNVTRDWTQRDTTLTTQHVQALEDWFDPLRNTYTYTLWNGADWGCVVPSYRNPDTLPGCGSACREQLREDGNTLRNGLAAGVTKAARFTLLEGWTNIAESAGFYRSDAWRYPNQYLNIVREYSDPETRTLRFQAEAADAWFDTTPGNAGTAYRDGDLDIGHLTGASGGWYVGWTQPGEWIEFKEVALACGVYRFTARLSGTVGQSLRLEVDGQSLGSVPLIRAGHPGGWNLLRLGTVALPAGPHNLRLVFETGQINVDWVFSRKLSSAGLGCGCAHLRSINGPYITARNGGGGLVRADSVTANEFESFTLIDLNGDPLRSGDTVSLLTWNGRNYLRAENGGGGTVSATSTQIGTWERFRILRLSGGGTISNGDSIALQAGNNQYIVAENGGGGIVNANRNAIGPWETFRLETCP